MTHVDLSNMVRIFDESLRKIINHLEEKDCDKALIRAKETHDKFREMINHIHISGEEVIKKI